MSTTISCGEQACQGDGGVSDFAVTIPAQPDERYSFSYSIAFDDGADAFGNPTVQVIGRGLAQVVVKFKDPPPPVEFSIVWILVRDTSP